MLWIQLFWNFPTKITGQTGHVSTPRCLSIIKDSADEAVAPDHLARIATGLNLRSTQCILMHFPSTPCLYKAGRPNVLLRNDGVELGFEASRFLATPLSSRYLANNISVQKQAPHTLTA